MRNNAMAMGLSTRIICGAMAIMTIILSMGVNTMAQTKSTAVVKNIVLVHGHTGFDEAEVSQRAIHASGILNLVESSVPEACKSYRSKGEPKWQPLQVSTSLKWDVL
jgi:hypothetical protein